jgi:hypothetical protein
MTHARNRVHNELTLNERLAGHAREVRRRAELLPNGDPRDALLEKARQCEAQISFKDELFDGSRRAPCIPHRPCSLQAADRAVMKL